MPSVHEVSEPLAGLWASEGAIYQRFGYGLSTLLGRFEIDRSRTAFARPVQWEGSVRQVVRDDAMALFPPVHERVVERYPGMIGRTKAHWEHDYADLERNRDGAGPLFFAVYESHEGAEGYVAYRVKAEWQASIDAVRSIMRHGELLEGNKLLARSIRSRFPYIDPLNHVQIELLRRHRAGDTTPEVVQGIHLSINGIAAGLRNSG